MTTLLLDNYDSFTWNLHQCVGALGGDPIVRRNDAVTLRDVAAMRPRRIILSPGPGSAEDPAYFGICASVIRELGETIPILGVCLGHQGVFASYGGAIVRASRPMHGKTSAVTHDGSALYTDIPRTFEAMRYHSLTCDPKTLPACLTVTARADDGTIMGISHASRPTFGVQFHPESIGTPRGRTIVENFLRISR